MWAMNSRSEKQSVSNHEHLIKTGEKVMKEKIAQIIEKQKEFFETQQTKEIKFRITQLKKLKRLIIDNEKELLKSLELDLKKPHVESYLSEVGLILAEINYALKNIKKWTKQKKVSTPYLYFPAKSYIMPEPYGITLIISTWNYPLQLPLIPLVGAIAAGNCAILKPSEQAEHTSKTIAKLIPEYFSPSYITVIQNGIDIAQDLLEQKFDYIFFTGSKKVGKIVMQAAAENLTPLTLELGGKSPCIITETANLKIAAKRIAWGKFFNAGQTCVAPDYVLINSKIKKEFLKHLVKIVEEFYGKDPNQSPDFARIINEKHLSRLSELLGVGNIITGGQIKPGQNYLAPTFIDDIKPTDKIMQDEIFGPILPIVAYNDLPQAIEIIKNKPKPLALYIFSKNKKVIEKILQQISAGGVTVNDTMLHSSTTTLPFGGIGSSGFGKYHGKASFDTFSHQKSILKRSYWFDFSFRYPPYKNKYLKIKNLFRYFF